MMRLYPLLLAVAVATRLQLGRMVKYGLSDEEVNFSSANEVSVSKNYHKFSLSLDQSTGLVTAKCDSNVLLYIQNDENSQLYPPMPDFSLQWKGPIHLSPLSIKHMPLTLKPNDFIILLLPRFRGENFLKVDRRDFKGALYDVGDNETAMDLAQDLARLLRHWPALRDEVSLLAMVVENDNKMIIENDDGHENTYGTSISISHGNYRFEPWRTGKTDETSSSDSIVRSSSSDDRQLPKSQTTPANNPRTLPRGPVTNRPARPPVTTAVYRPFYFSSTTSTTSSSSSTSSEELPPAQPAPQPTARKAKSESDDSSSSNSSSDSSSSSS